MPRIDVRTSVDQATLDRVLTLIDEVAQIEGHPPVGEHKYAHLQSGRDDWVGLLAYVDDELAGYVHTRWNAPGEYPRMAAEMVVHPGRGGADTERALLEETRRVLARAGGGSLFLWLHRVDDPASTAPARLGFAIQRELAFMTRRLDEPPAQPDPPAGVRLRAYRPGLDDAAFLHVNNAAFAGHPENGEWTAAELAARRSLDWFDPDGLLMAWRGDEAVGFHWTKWHGHDADEVRAHDPVGEVYVLAVHPAEHGTGLGRYLLRAGSGHLWERGCRVVVLYVDCANTTAVQLYASEGFVEDSREICYEDRVEPDTGLDASELLRPA